jgi:hypothetical protein
MNLHPSEIDENINFVDRNKGSISDSVTGDDVGESLEGVVLDL